MYFLITSRCFTFLYLDNYFNNDSLILSYKINFIYNYIFKTKMT